MLQTLTLAYMLLIAREVTKQTKTKAITRVKLGRNKKKCNQNLRRQKAGTCSKKEQERMNSAVGTKFPTFNFLCIFCSSFFIVSDMKC